MLTSTAWIQTQNAQRLMNRLCKHWGHKFPVTLDAQQAEIELPLGVCRMHGADALAVELQSDAAQMPKLQQVVADHLQRMAARETLDIEWQ
ncbi:MULTISPECIES: DUF2218 domain-containing protein [unclassified Halomonas]|uniref:DUF2218 domain-containing protein n=1 Tax=unclassified Halomonas TaxID=2609666 RepID=UPI002885C1F6|nr:MULTISPECIES: DUF2218 domain-containing protein [unclassified Halomonas]MDT0500777.1 DUF2218 domain-containing protein [Halomonas sp. PAR7]MDT0513033.1 DUF2218 domain-containing protein [Halomonas sp. LES1]MDT0591556.1 DUF2218 domain-containing protein [Halomonas sp. PAR8]